jgi:hypothetical protein
VLVIDDARITKRGNKEKEAAELETKSVTQSLVSKEILDKP